MSFTTQTIPEGCPPTPEQHATRPVALRMAVTAGDRERIFRFRYEIYVEEMGRAQRHADHARRRIEEPLDATAHLMIAERDGRTLGTLRTNFARETDLGYYVRLFQLDSVGAAFPSRVSLTTKLMIRPELRSGTLAVRLATAIYRFGLAQGIDHDFIDCNAHLERFFQRLGFRTYMDKAVHPEFGSVLPLRLDLRDEQHLRRIGSPLHRG